MDIVALSHLIARDYSGQTGDAAALTTTLNTASIAKTDSGRKLMGDVKTVIGADATTRLLDSMDAAGATNALIRHAKTQLSSAGLDFTDTDVRAAIDSMAANVALPMTTADATAVKEIGMWNATPYENAGGSGQVPQVDVEAAIAMYELRELWSQITFTVTAGIEDQTYSTKADVSNYVSQQLM